MEQAPKLYFHVKVMDVFDGREMPALRPDEHGYYKLPVAAINTKSRNNTWYDTQSIMNEITNPNTLFHQQLTQGQLYGEFEHPSINSDLNRIEAIDGNRKSHHIRAVYLGDIEDDGSQLIYNELKPVYPYGKKSGLEDSLLNPYENTAFSLRSLMKEKYDTARKCMYRNIVRLVTFDYVVMQGFLKACKRFAQSNIGNESLYSDNSPTSISKELKLNDFFQPNGERIAAFESITDGSLQELFEISPMMFNKTREGIYLKNKGFYLDDKGVKRSLTNAVLSFKK